MVNEGLAFYRRRLSLASERVADLSYAVTRLEDDDAEAAVAWTDSLAREVRGRELEPHRKAALIQQGALGRAIESQMTILAALEEIARLEHTVVSAIAHARTAAQSAEARAIESRRIADGARSEVGAAEAAVSSAAGMAGGLM
jgi:hypothetical protein